MQLHCKWFYSNQLLSKISYKIHLQLIFKYVITYILEKGQFTNLLLKFIPTAHKIKILDSSFISFDMYISPSPVLTETLSPSIDEDGFSCCML